MKKKEKRKKIVNFHEEQTKKNYGFIKKEKMNQNMKKSRY